MRGKGRVCKPHFTGTTPRVREGASFSKTLRFELSIPGRRPQVFFLRKHGLEKPGEVILVHLGCYSPRPQTGP